MRSLTTYIILLIIFSVSAANGQVTTNDTPKVLEKLYGRLISNYNDTERIRINDSVRTIIDSYVKSDTVFTHKFKNLRYLGQITSRDSLIKIITWNLILINKPSRYYCYLLRRQPSQKKNMIYWLETDYKESSVMTDRTYSETDWYGALYYEIRPLKTDSSKYWVLLGIDYGNPFITRKIIEVLNISKADSILFGKKLFDSGDKVKYREVFEYASNAMMSLRFGSDTSIVFDHLVPFSPSQKNDRQYYGPDYSNDAYYLENGIWKLKINVDVRNKE